MKKEKKSLDFVQQEECEHDRPVTEGDIHRLRSAQKLMDEVASRIPPLSPEQIHSVVEGDRLPQFQFRRQADRYLLIFCLLFLALVASVLFRTAPAGITPLNVALLVLGGMDAWVVLRAARSLWLMRQTLRLRHRPYRMLRYSDLLHRLSHRRRWWIDTVLWPNHATSAQDSPRIEIATLRISSYAIAVCLFLLIFVNSDKAFASTRTYANVTTNTEKTATAIYDSVNQTIMQIWNNNSTRKDSGLL